MMENLKKIKDLAKATENLYLLNLANKLDKEIKEKYKL